MYLLPRPHWSVLRFAESPSLPPIDEQQHSHDHDANDHDPGDIPVLNASHGPEYTPPFTTPRSCNDPAPGRPTGHPARRTRHRAGNATTACLSLLRVSVWANPEGGNSMNSLKQAWRGLPKWARLVMILAVVAFILFWNADDITSGFRAGMRDAERAAEQRPTVAKPPTDQQ